MHASAARSGTAIQPPAATPGGRPRLGKHVRGLLVFIGFPALWTMAKPVSWVRFEREAGRVSVNTRICLLFVVPYSRVTLDEVTDVSTDTIAPTPRSGSLSTTAVSEHFLVLQEASGRTSAIPVAASSRDQLRQRVQTFLQDSQATELSFFAPSNWGLAVFGGGVLSLLPVFYIFNAIDLWLHIRRQKRAES